MYAFYAQIAFSHALAKSLWLKFMQYKVRNNCILGPETLNGIETKESEREVVHDKYVCKKIYCLLKKMRKLIYKNMFVLWPNTGKHVDLNTQRASEKANFSYEYTFGPESFGKIPKESRKVQANS